MPLTAEPTDMPAPSRSLSRLYETHMHTPWCRHAVGEPDEYAEVAECRGLAGITVTCHNPLPDGLAQGSRMYPCDFDRYVADVLAARDKWAGRVDVRLGLEADYLPGLEAFLDRQLTSQPFSYVLGSVHPQLTEYQQRYWTGDPLDFSRQYFTSLAEAAETKLFDALSHPDLVKNCVPQHYDLSMLMPHVQRCLDRIAKAGTAMELNTSGLLKAVTEMNPASAILAEMNHRGIPVVIGADAHTPLRCGADFELALHLVERAGYRHVSLFLDRQRHEVPIDTARRSLRPAAE